MAAKAKPPTRAELQRQIDELDLNRLKRLREIFAGEAFQSALAEVKELADETDTTAVHRSSSADTNALLANALVPFYNVPAIAEALERTLDSRLNPPAEPQTAALQVPGADALKRA